MEYIRGETVYFSFAVQDSMGAKINPDSPPALTVKVNGVDATAAWVVSGLAATVGDTGEYDGSVVVPAATAYDAIVAIKAQVTIAAVVSPRVTVSGGRFRIVRFRPIHATLNRMERFKHTDNNWYVRLWNEGETAELMRKKLLDRYGFPVTDLPGGILAIEVKNTAP